MTVFRISVLLTIAVAASAATADAPVPSPKLAFDQLKSLAGEWEGTLTTNPPDPSVQGKISHITLRVTSMGNAFLHEMKVPGRDDDPITMLYLDGDRLMLTHYCDAGNRPRMEGRMTSDGKKVEFNLIDVAGNMQHGHMHKSAFTFVDAAHHMEDWTFMIDKGPVLAHFDLHRVQ